jgi:GNAT superfamily N-acetyltransferase
MQLKEVDASSPTKASELLYLHQECFEVDKPCDFSKGFWWIAYDEGAPVAFGGLTQSSQYSDVGYLCRSGVLPSHQGRGLQKRLIKARERKARKLGWNWLRTDTHDNPASSNSLISCGFRLYQPYRPWAFKHSLYFRKKL